MQIEFEKGYLRELFEEGKAKNKKYRFTPQLIRQYVKTVNILKQAPNTEFLYKLKSLRYEKKKGKLKDVEAVYLNKQFRLLFKTYERGEEPSIIVVCELSDISKHYE